MGNFNQGLDEGRLRNWLAITPLDRAVKDGIEFFIDQNNLGEEVIDEMEKEIEAYKAEIEKLNTKIKQLEEELYKKNQAASSGIQQNERMIKAKFDSNCTKCGGKTAEGQKVFWIPGAKTVRHAIEVECKG